MHIKPYQRKPHYYETDQMGVVHHSNYIRWFEEARVDLMEQVGFGYDRMEREGIVSPVLSASCSYRSMVRFGQEVVIHLRLVSFTGTRMTLSYRVEDARDRRLCAEGETHHCFLNTRGRPVSLKKTNPEAHSLFSDLAQSHDRGKK